MKMSKANICYSILLFLVVLFSFRIWWTTEIYSAEIVSPPYLDTYEKQTAKFLKVKPISEDYFSGRNPDGSLKLILQDSYLPGLFAVNNERFDGVKATEVVCIKTRGMRLDWLSWYPNAITYQRGKCNEQS